MSGKLDETLVRLHAYFEDEGFRTLRLFTRILNGVIYGTVVILVAFNIIHFWMNYYGNLLNDF
jgi:type II secretory pathway component PulF